MTGRVERPGETTPLTTLVAEQPTDHGARFSGHLELAQLVPTPSDATVPHPRTPDETRPQPQQDGYLSRLEERIRKNFADAFAAPLGPSDEFMRPTDSLPRYLWPVQALNNAFYRGGGTALDAAARTVQAAYFSGVDATVETLQTSGLVDRGDRRLERDLKALPGALAGMGALGGTAVTRGPAVRPITLPPAGRQVITEAEVFAPGSLGAARAWTISARLQAQDLPTTGRIRYVPPRNYHPNNPLPRGQNNGFLDRFDNEWVRGPSRTQGQAFEWDVQLSRTGQHQLGWASRDGRHLNVSLDGHITH
jgi:Novel toxin 17